MLGHTDEVLPLLATLFVLNIDLAVTALDLTKGNDTVNFGGYRGVGRITCFEKLRYPGQTTGDILDLTEVTRRLTPLVDTLELRTIFDGDVRAYGQVVAPQFFAIGADDLDGRNLALVFAFHDNFFLVARLIIPLNPVG